MSFQGPHSSRLRTTAGRRLFSITHSFKLGQSSSSYKFHHDRHHAVDYIVICQYELSENEQAGQELILKNAGHIGCRNEFVLSWLRPSSSMNGSVHPSVSLSHLFDCVSIIVSSGNFQDLLPMTKVRSTQKVKVRGQRSRSQRSTPNLAISGL